MPCITMQGLAVQNGILINCTHIVSKRSKSCCLPQTVAVTCRQGGPPQRVASWYMAAPPDLVSPTRDCCWGPEPVSPTAVL